MFDSLACKYRFRHSLIHLDVLDVLEIVFAELLAFVVEGLTFWVSVLLGL